MTYKELEQMGIEYLKNNPSTKLTAFRYCLDTNTVFTEPDTSKENVYVLWNDGKTWYENNDKNGMLITVYANHSIVKNYRYTLLNLII